MRKVFDGNPTYRRTILWTIFRIQWLVEVVSRFTGYYPVDTTISGAAIRAESANRAFECVQQNAEKNATYRNQSTATIIVMSSVGKPIAVNTSSMVTSPADGTEAAPILAAVAVRLTVTTLPMVNSIPFNCAMNIAATASYLRMEERERLASDEWPESDENDQISSCSISTYRAVPSILTVAPTGSTNLVTRLSTPRLSSKHLKESEEEELIRVSRIRMHTKILSSGALKFKGRDLKIPWK